MVTLLIGLPLREEAAFGALVQGFNYSPPTLGQGVGMEKRKRGNPFEFPFSPLRIHTDLVRTFRDGVRRNASAGWRNHRGQRQTRGICCI